MNNVLNGPALLLVHFFDSEKREQLCEAKV